MRIRLSFAGAFVLLLLIAAYMGLTSLQLGQYVNDKFLHCTTFFILTVVFYWVVDTSRRRTVHMTLVVCTLTLGIGSEFVQSFLPNDRDFDMYDIVANLVGSLAALALCSWYHKRMLERKRLRRNTYNAVPGDDELDDVDGQDHVDADLELGEGHETGILQALPPRSLEQEVDNWDEHAPDDDDDDDEDDEWEESDGISAPQRKTKAKKGTRDDEVGDAKKRTD
ncbi:VanZ like family [Geosmithia morbida]|uniref:VanZ like family n=1 Tax=Geosmithia morbida TaxID=1094350 RepID=A0A9P5D6Y5_9HYPO|nr:VanZ like family [Geosmithia morbida]KAF4126046.1 VanZ like family [Geosmithia morbida]